METKMKMMTRAEKEGVRERERRQSEEREGNKEERRRGKTQTWTPNVYVLARTTFKILNGCAAVQAGAFKALAGSSTHKKLAQRIDSLVRDGSKRDQKYARM